ncbi:uracil-DNA glycosylase [Rariglobus hedericola]|uniref:Type-4 uracil-DNA glycosylase n=1 Tax=Rariglobus hedericola TaxID=2597822 RepID=A0A556QNZ5_9BACT|nr:uracil-DNA glycosylase [Rariglobus hedericola]TSJ78364.1 uracil-DNA glycosylase [Rariglobus hedericola]
MRAALTALTDELKRLKSTGVSSVAVSAESIATLRKVISARAVAAGSTTAVTAPAARTPAAVEATAPRSAPITRSEPAAAPKPKVEAERLLPPPPVVILPAGDKATRWAWLQDLVLNHPVCTAHVRPGKKVVLGVGSLDAKIMFVGEAPGAEEEVQGEPFVGPAGQLLTKMILAMGVKREDIYIGNIMNWRPQTPTAEGVEQVGNRAPTPEEMSFCLPFLRAQIEIVNPDLIVALGSTAAQGLLGAGSFKTLGEVRGQWKQFSEKPVIVTYHPSYLLRQEASSPSAARKAKRATWEDLLKVMERAGLTISDKQRGYFLEK